jgi:tetratricopeptide (TPR) repeat protein
MAQGMDRQINPKECSKYAFLSLVMLIPLALGFFGKEVKASPRSTCRVVARVAYTSNPADLFKPLCAGQSITLPANTKAVCLSNLQIVPVRTAKDLDLCNVASQNLLESCDLSNPDKKSLCDGVSRSNLEVNRPVLEAPYGVVLRPQPIELRWRVVDGADAYRVVVDGDRNRSKVITPNTVLQLTLKEGTVSIITQALKSGQVISSSVKTFDVISEQKSYSLFSKLKQIDNSKFPDHEKSLVKVAILNQYELLNDSKEYLEKQIRLSTSTLLSITLANIYLKLGLYTESKNQYKEAISLAEASKDTVELDIARKNYKIISEILEKSLQPRS